MAPVPLVLTCPVKQLADEPKVWMIQAPKTIFAMKHAPLAPGSVMSRGFLAARLRYTAPGTERAGGLTDGRE